MKSRLHSIFFVLLVTSLAIEGILLLFTGWWLPEVPILLRLTGVAWLVVCVSTYFIRTSPTVQLTTAWLFLLVSVWNWWKVTDERSMPWFLYQNVLPVLTLVSSHLTVISRRQKIEGEA